MTGLKKDGVEGLLLYWVLLRLCAGRNGRISVANRLGLTGLSILGLYVSEQWRAAEDLCVVWRVAD